jgi:hypothetical protein
LQLQSWQPCSAETLSMLALGCPPFPRWGTIKVEMNGFSFVLNNCCKLHKSRGTATFWWMTNLPLDHSDPFSSNRAMMRGWERSLVASSRKLQLTNSCLNSSLYRKLPYPRLICMNLTYEKAFGRAGFTRVLETSAGESLPTACGWSF